MPFLLSDDEALIEKTVAEFARDQIGIETAEELDRHDRFPEAPLAAAAQLGLLGMSLPEEKGGAGITPGAYALAVLETAKVCCNTAAVLAAHNGALRILQHGPDEVLAKAIAGEVVATLATEEAHGSDKATLGTSAQKTDKGWSLTGMKVWGLGAAGAKHLLVLAQAEEGPTFFHVPADADGVTLGRNEALLGLRASGIRTAYLSNVAMPEDAIVGKPGSGLELWQAAQPWLQVGCAAALTGATLGAFEAARAFAEDRVQFGKPIGTYQAVSDAVTEVDIQAAAARALVLEAAAHLDGDDAPLWAARAKAFAGQAAIWMTRKNIRIQGGTGFMRESQTERFARDVRALQFVGEPVVIQRDTLKRRLLDIEFDTAP